MIEKLFERIELPFPNSKIEIFTDGNDDYAYLLPEYYAKTCMNYAVDKDQREGNSGCKGE